MASYIPNILFEYRLFNKLSGCGLSYVSECTISEVFVQQLKVYIDILE